jgi:hypothetical protein
MIIIIIKPDANTKMHESGRIYSRKVGITVMKLEIEEVEVI